MPAPQKNNLTAGLQSLTSGGDQQTHGCASVSRLEDGNNDDNGSGGYGFSRNSCSTGNFIVLQPNAVFESEREMLDWISSNTPGAKVVRQWKVEMIACEIEVEQRFKTRGKVKRRG